MIEVGKSSPIGIVCDDKVVIELQHMMSPMNYQLLTKLFCGDDVTSYRKELEMLDMYLDIPLVKAYFDQTSYPAFVRLVENQCTIFPPYVNTEGLDFCVQAAKENKLDVLQKAYELGFHLDPSICEIAVMNKNSDILCFYIDQGGDLEKVPMHYLVQLNIKTTNRMQKYDYLCVYAAIENQNLDMLQHIHDHNHISLPQFVYHTECIGNVITTVKLFQVVYNLFPHLFDFDDYDIMFKFAINNGDIELLRTIVNSNDELNIHPSWCRDKMNLDIMRFMFEEVVIWDFKDWNKLIRYHLDHEDLLQYILTYCYRDEKGDMSNMTTSTSKQFPITQRTYRAMAAKGRIDLFKKFACGTPDFAVKLDIRIMGVAIDYNQLEMVKYLQSQGCPWPLQNNAAKKGYFALLKYLHEQGCPCHKSCHSYYHESKIPFCVL